MNAIDLKGRVAVIMCGHNWVTECACSFVETSVAAQQSWGHAVAKIFHLAPQVAGANAEPLVLAWTQGGRGRSRCRLSRINPRLFV